MANHFLNYYASSKKTKLLGSIDIRTVSAANQSQHTAAHPGSLQTGAVLSLFLARAQVEQIDLLDMLGTFELMFQGGSVYAYVRGVC